MMKNVVIRFRGNLISVAVSLLCASTVAFADQNPQEVSKSESVIAAQPLSDNEQFLEAARDGKISELSQLLKAGAMLHFRDQNGCEAFDYAVEYHQLNASHALLKYALQKAVLNKTDQEFANAALNHEDLTDLLASEQTKIALLRLFANQGKINDVNKILRTGLSVDAGAESGYTALMLASRWGHQELVGQLLKTGANPNLHANTCKRPTALLEAARDGSINIAIQLVSKGAKINEVDKYGDHALNWAASFGHIDFANMMVSQGADLTKAGRTNENALGIAIRQGHTRLVESLQNAGAVLFDKKSASAARISK